MKKRQIDRESGNFNSQATARRMKEWSSKHFGTVRGTAKAMKMTESNLQQYLTGVRKPGFTILLRLCQLGCDINWLMSGKELADKVRLKKRVQEMDKLIAKMKMLTR